MDFPMKYGGFQSINEKAGSPWYLKGWYHKIGCILNQDQPGPFR